MAPASSRRAPAISTAAPAFSSRPGPGGAAAAYACGERGGSGQGPPARDPQPGTPTGPVLSRPVPFHRHLSRPHPFPTVRPAGSRSTPTHAHTLSRSHPVPPGACRQHSRGAGTAPHRRAPLGRWAPSRSPLPWLPREGEQPGLDPGPGPGPGGAAPPRPAPRQRRARPAGMAAPPRPGHNEPLQLRGSARAPLCLLPHRRPLQPTPRLQLRARVGTRGFRGHAAPARRGGEKGCPVR